MDEASYRRGIALFNEEKFFEAHEALEDAWRSAPGPQKAFYQGLTQLAVAFAHYQRGNPEGARTVLERGLENLSPYPDYFAGLDLGALRRQLLAAKAATQPVEAAPPPPRMQMVESPLLVKDTVQSVPMLDLHRQYEQIRDQILPALERVCASQHFVGGDEVAGFERESSAFLGAAHAVGCASGTDALWLSLQAAGIGPGDAVITTAFSFFASTSTIVRAGATPVFVDVDPATLNIDVAAVEHRIREGVPNLRALLPVHLYGQCADMGALRRIAHEHKLVIIEDAAQAFGAAWDGQRAGTLGDVAGFSFYPTKNLSAYGDGGLVTTSNDAIAERVLSLRNHGSRQRYYHTEIGWNSRLDALQAAVLRIKLPHIADWNEARRARAATYDRFFGEAGVGQVRSLTTLPEAYHVFHQYVVRVARRDELRAFLAENGIGTEVYYPVPLHLQECFAYLGYRKGDFPHSENAAQEVLALPMFPELREDEQRYVVAKIVEFYAGGSRGSQ